MELHVSLAAAVPNALYVEHIPQLRRNRPLRDSGRGRDGDPPSTHGIGIEWDREAIDSLAQN